MAKFTGWIRTVRTRIQDCSTFFFLVIEGAVSLGVTWFDRVREARLGHQAMDKRAGEGVVWSIVSSKLVIVLIGKHYEKVLCERMMHVDSQDPFKYGCHGNIGTYSVKAWCTLASKIHSSMATMGRFISQAEDLDKTHRILQEVDNSEWTCM